MTKHHFQIIYEALDLSEQYYKKNKKAQTTNELLNNLENDLKLTWSSSYADQLLKGVIKTPHLIPNVTEILKAKSLSIKPKLKKYNRFPDRNYQKVKAIFQAFEEWYFIN